MKQSIRVALIILASIIISTTVAAQNKRHTISGSITDAKDGEDLIGVQIRKDGTNVGTTTNSYGFYSLSLPEGEHTIVVNYMGYVEQVIKLDLRATKKINIKLETNETQLSEVVVTARSKTANVTEAEMSVERLSSKAIKNIPALMGEVDVIKAVQLLPGVQATSEGSSGFSVRGGGVDQNLVLLDEATVYNASHLLGFFSVFNNDAVKDLTLYKGDIPATFGGRLSSLLDIRSKDGNNQNYSGTGGIGLIASRMTFEGPLGSDKSSFLVSGRRTYADLFLKLSNDEDTKNSTLYFYDMNAKFNYRINDNNRIFFSGYLGRDKFGTKFASMDFGNKTATLRWNHIFSPKLFSNFTLIGSFYDYGIGADIDEAINQKWKSKMNDYGFKADLSYHPNPNTNIMFGYNTVYHDFSPGIGGGVGENSIIGSMDLPKEYALEHAGYVATELKFFEKLKIKLGLRYSAFQNIANGEDVRYLQDYQLDHVKDYKKGKFYKTQQQLEPRLGALYLFNNENSVKASYSRTSQYIQIASNSAAGSPLDVWFQASQNVKPQLSDQFAIGYFRNLDNNMYEVSAEIYYKKLKNVIDFKDHAKLMANKELEDELRFGKGKAYGLELMLRKNHGKLNGWVSYTLSKSRRQVDDVNDNNWYRSPYDKPHNISIVGNYEISPKWTVSANWVYASGTPVTYPTGRYLVENNYVPIYSGRNEFRFPDYHRLDLSATVQLTKPTKKFKNELNFSLYNAYGRRNPWTIVFKQETDNPDKSYAEAVYLFSFVPSITWNFTF